MGVWSVCVPECGFGLFFCSLVAALSFFFFFFLYGLGSKNGDTSLGFYLCAGNGRPVGPEVLLCVEEEEPAAPLRGV